MSASGAVSPRHEGHIAIDALVDRRSDSATPEAWIDLDGADAVFNFSATISAQLPASSSKPRSRLLLISRISTMLDGGYPSEWNH